MIKSMTSYEWKNARISLNLVTSIITRNCHTRNSERCRNCLKALSDLMEIDAYKKIAVGYNYGYSNYHLNGTL